MGTLKVGRYGRITLPKDVRQRHGISEGTRLIIREQGNQITLTPITTHENPTEAPYGSVPLTPPVNDPKEIARRHLHNMEKRREAGEELLASLEKREHTVPEGFINETIRRTRESPRST